MRQQGFTLIELVTVMLIIGIIAAIASLNFGQMSRKAKREGQMRTMQADIMAMRSQSLFRKETHTMTVTATDFTVTAGGVTVLQKELHYPLSLGAAVVIDFDSRGMAVDSGGGFAEQPFCLDVESDAVVDSIIITPVRTYLGKRNAGGACDLASIVIK